MHRTIGKALLMALACLVTFPLVASAQSAITGQVKDESGGVLPGVTVEAASPVLIEKIRSAITDDQGRYRIIDLRPGTYSVTFSLPGFSTQVRGDVDLPANFVATINGDLKVGTLAETVTVTSQSPTVDISQASKTLVLTRDLYDALPSTRNLHTVGQLVPGLRQSTPDVGGSRLMETSGMYGHGANNRNQTFLVDGLMINVNKSDGSLIQYTNDANNAEVSVTTSAMPAERGAGGVVVNSIPREGGNIFSGATFIGLTQGSWMSDNINDDLRKRGLTLPNTIEKIHNMQVSEGGPILRNKLWFFIAAAHLKSNENVANVPDPLVLPAGVTCQDKDRCDGSNFDTTQDQFLEHVSARLTTQMTQKNKASVFFNRSFKHKGLEYAFGTDPYNSSRRRPAKQLTYFIAQAKWTSTISNRLMVDAGFSANSFFYNTGAQEWQLEPARLPNGQLNPAWINKPSYTDTALNKNPNCFLADGCLLWGPFGQELGEHALRNVFAASATYVTGSHSFRAGFNMSQGPRDLKSRRPADLIANFVSGRASTVTVWNTPFDGKGTLNYDLGIYVQDSWVIKRLTLNPGLRVEYLDAEARTTEMLPGRFAPFRHYDAEKGFPPNFKNDLAPRFSAAYDLFGDGRTALKGSVSKYFAPYTTTFVDLYSDAVEASESRNWFDADLVPGTSTVSTLNLPTNNDGIPQDNEIGPSANPNFGVTGSDNTFNPDIKKFYNIEYTATLQRQLFDRVSASVGYYRRTYRNMVVNDRTLITNADYTSFQVPMPDFSQDPDVAAVLDRNEVLTIYNLNAAKRSSFGTALVDDSSSGALGDRGANQSIYNGFESNLMARLPNGGTIFGAWTADRNISVMCDTNDNPNGTTTNDLSNAGTVSNGGRFCDQREFDVPFRHEFKIAGTYPLPYRLEFAIAMQSYAGLQRLITWTPAATLFPGGRTNSQTIVLTKPGSLYYPRYNQVDINMKKNFAIGKKQSTVQFDIFNVFNSGAILTETNAIGASLGRVNSILYGRMPRVVFQMKW